MLAGEAEIAARLFAGDPPFLDQDGIHPGSGAGMGGGAAGDAAAHDDDIRAGPVHGLLLRASVAQRVQFALKRPVGLGVR